MKRFRFPLQSVSTLRSWREGQAREAFGARMRDLRDADDAVQRAKQRAVEIERQLCEARSTRFLPGEQVAFLAALQEQQATVVRATQARDEARQAADRAREAWQIRRNELRAMHQLEQRARQAHRLEQDRAEQALMDELASLRAIRPAAHLT